MSVTDGDPLLRALPEMPGFATLTSQILLTPSHHLAEHTHQYDGVTSNRALGTRGTPCLLGGCPRKRQLLLVLTRSAPSALPAHWELHRGGGGIQRKKKETYPRCRRSKWEHENFEVL